MPFDIGFYCGAQRRTSHAGCGYCVDTDVGNFTVGYRFSSDRALAAELLMPSTFK